MLKPAQEVYGLTRYERYNYHNLYELYLRVITGIMTDLGIQAYEKCEDEDNKELLKECILGIFDENKPIAIGKTTIDLLKDLDNKYSETLPAAFRDKGWTIKDASRTGVPLDIRRNWYDDGGRSLANPGTMSCGSGTLQSRNQILSWGKYAVQCMQLYHCLNRFDEYKSIMHIMGRAIYVANIVIRMRNVLYSHSTQNRSYFNWLETLTEWLSNTDDPVFGKHYSICAPAYINQKNNKIECLKEEGSSISLDKSYLIRSNIIGDASSVDDVFSASYLFIDDWNLQDLDFSDYIRISPYFGIDSETMNRRHRLSSECYGLLMHVTKQNNYRFMILVDTTSVLLDEEEGEDDKYTFELKANAELNSAHENDKSFVTYNDVTINKSRHPEFVEAQIEERDFIYLKIIGDNDDRVLEQFQRKNSIVFFVYIYGHGGLGKTHIVLNMLRENYFQKQKKKNKKQEAPFFKQIIFLSAKRKIMDVEKRKEKLLNRDEFDVESYENVLHALYTELTDTEKRIGDNSNLSVTDLENRVREIVKRREEPLLIVIDDLDTLDEVNERSICQFLGNIQSSMCRIIITSRYYIPENVRGVPTTSISLHPLDEEGSWNFLQKYAAKKQGAERDARALLADWYLDGVETKKRRLYQMTGGVPLKLVLLTGMLLHGYDANSIWSAAESSMRITDTFMYRNLLENVSAYSKVIMGTLGAIITCFSDGHNDEFREIGISTLRLFIPELDERDYNVGIDELTAVSVFIRISSTVPGESDQVLFRSPELSSMREIRELSLPESTKELLNDLKENPVHWRRCFYFPSVLLDELLRICFGWRQRKDEESLRWVSLLTSIVLKHNRDNFAHNSYENWKALEQCVNIEISIMTLEDYGYEEYSEQWSVVLKNLVGLENSWSREKSLILKAFQTCLDYADECAKNGNNELCRKIRKNTVECYNDFCENAGKDYLDKELDNSIQRAAFLGV